MKIASLLPSATEIVYALGLGDQLEAVTFECDHPLEARSKPVVSTTALPADVGMTARQIDDEVRGRVGRGEPLYRLDRAGIADINPDLILTQDLCRVCAVPTGDVEQALELLGCRAEVVSLDPCTLDGVLDSIALVGDVTGTADRAARLVGALGARVTAVRDAVAGRPRPRTLALEWSDPPFSGGHWVPDLLDAAGAEPLLAASGTPSRRLDWGEVAAAAPEGVVFMPCGYSLEHALAEGRHLLAERAITEVARVWVADANGYFSRPGPRVVDAVEALAASLHPGAVPHAPLGVIASLRG